MSWCSSTCQKIMGKHGMGISGHAPAGGSLTLPDVCLTRWQCRSDGQGPPGYSPGVGQFDSDIFNGLDNLYPGVWSLPARCCFSNA